MGLLRLSKNPVGFDPIVKAKGIVQSIPSKALIRSARIFGSAVSGNMTPDSDLDILLTFDNLNNLELVKNEIFYVIKVDIAIDWIFKIHDDYELNKDIGGVCFEAAHYGKDIL
ncbi:MAG: nucleotidyltransferase domain-containing protein [Bdellovibrionales bacterium]|nr:nucleotidyltransferase domain-containing protein [Bdellovibrionales bacterium]